ncbi:hypothetical protein [Streptomyces geranii]|uniref:hypothetical protein n=1 Tax=Streptomyces geranii TaxID=2058923 RepID=UPI0013002978|nr:hypothetical protein [Streptomyces geranii]
MPAPQTPPMTKPQPAGASGRRRRRTKVLLWRAALGAASAAGAGLVTVAIDRISSLL